MGQVDKAIKHIKDLDCLPSLEALRHFEIVRQTGLTNMYDTYMVQRIMYDRGLYEGVNWIQKLIEARRSPLHLLIEYDEELRLLYDFQDLSELVNDEYKLKAEFHAAETAVERAQRELLRAQRELELRRASQNE